jgi:two-component system chemotaxis response regulator CheB
VQHRDEGDESVLDLLAGRSTLPLVEAEDKQRIAPGQVYLAPAGYHLLVEDGGLALSTEAPVCSARPSIDVLFESAADTFSKGVIGVLLAGAGEDGSLGVTRIRDSGGLVIFQDLGTARGGAPPEGVLPSDPREALPLSDIASFLIERCAASRTRRF